MKSISAYSAILVDDEQAAHYAIQVLLKEYDNISLVGQAYNGKQAIEMINRLRPDLLFLDIQMPDMNGFDVLHHLDYQPYIVFCTAYEQYAIDAFNQNSIDYLLKPVDEKRFAQCMAKIERLFPEERKMDICQLQELGKLLNPPKKAFAIPVNIGSKIVFVQCSIITYCVAKDGYVSLIDFIRVQKSYIVHKEKIEEIQKYFNNRLILKMRDYNHTKITSGTSYIDKIREELMLG